MEHHEIESLTREAANAFWEVVARRFPDTKTGDLSPLQTLAFHRAAEAAVREWVGNNVLAQEDREHTPDPVGPVAPSPESAATREFCVYATQVVYQNVEATGADEAYRIAKDDPHSFEPCCSSPTLDRAVQDIQADEFIRVGAAASHCLTCGSEIVETINQSNFNDGECGPCEYRRYRTQPELLTLVQTFRLDCADQVQQYRDDLKEDFGDPDDLQEQVEYWQGRRDQCDAAIAKANG